MKSNESLGSSELLELAACIYHDAVAKCPADVSDLRDLKTIRSRVEKEGLSFLTITLPDFARDFERSLANGQIDPTCFRRFKKLRLSNFRQGAIPAFLQGLLGHLFDRETGRILDENPITPILVEATRQICLFAKKVEVPCTLSREATALENFISVEQSNSLFSLSEEAVEEFSIASDVLWHNMLADISADMLIPRHGPGATAERISGNQKYVHVRWHERLEEYFPFLGNSYSVSAAGERDFKKVTFVRAEEEDPVRVTLVPKTLKAPRIIAIEPVCMQYAQQAVQRELYTRVETYWLTAGHVNFTDQSVNQQLALISSDTGQFATIDLSDASDRVLNSLATLMFRSNPYLQGLVQACRSTGALLPDGTLVSPLSKFASMGSALCFPVEAMYFYTIIVLALCKKHNLPLTPSSVFNVSRKVYVYGDDLVVPVDDAGAVLEYLQKYNCKVNANKTFITGRFRESCGVDAYAGLEVTPTYVRRLRPENRQQVDRVISYVATANLFYLKGYWRTASHMFAHCEKLLGELPYVTHRSSALGRISHLYQFSANGWDSDTHSLRVKGWVPKVVYRSDSVDGYPALQKCLLSLEYFEPRVRIHYDETLSELLQSQRGLFPREKDRMHLERSALRGAATLKHRWVPAT